MVPKIEVTGFEDYTRSAGYQTRSVIYEFETRTFNYDRGIRLPAEVMDIEKAGVRDCFAEAGFELRRIQVVPEADAFTFAEIAGHEGVESSETDYSDAEAEDILADLRAVTSEMDELQVSTGSRILFITPTLKGVLDDFSQVNPARCNRVLTRFSRVVEVPQVRFFTAIDLLSGESNRFGYRHAEGEYVATEDDAIVSGKTYYTLSGRLNALVSSPASGSLFGCYKLVGVGALISLVDEENSAGAFEALLGARMLIGAGSPLRVGVQTLLRAPRRRAPLGADGTMRGSGPRAISHMF